MNKCDHTYMDVGPDEEGLPRITCMECGIRVYARAANLHQDYRNNYCYPTCYLWSGLLEIRVGWQSHTCAYQSGRRVSHAYLAFSTPWDTHWVWMPTIYTEDHS